MQPYLAPETNTLDNLHCGNPTIMMDSIALDTGGLALQPTSGKKADDWKSKLPFLVRPNYNVCVDRQPLTVCSASLSVRFFSYAYSTQARNSHALASLLASC